jgi:hypothetical protein
MRNVYSSVILRAFFLVLPDHPFLYVAAVSAFFVGGLASALAACINGVNVKND